MNIIDSFFDRWMKPVDRLNPGVYQFQSPPDEEHPYRLHLKLEGDGSGILILNAHTVMHLNQTAAEYGYHWINQTPENEVVRQIRKRYRIDKKQVLSDFAEFKQRIDTMAHTTDIDPVTYLGFDRDEPYSTELSSPFRLDCALTYHTSQKDHNDAPNQRVIRELSYSEWKEILEKAWTAGIPHIIFTGGEPTLRTDLPELIACTQQIGQVSGLLTDGIRLAEPGYLTQLLQQGLDHLMIILDEKQEKVWKAIEISLAEDIHLTVHLTLDEKTSKKWEGILERLVGLGVKSLSLSASSQAYQEVMNKTHRSAAEKGIHLIWDLPVPYSSLNPVAIENQQVHETVEGAGKAWLYVEPDGDVLPCQGRAEEILGNILTDSWQTIWDKAISIKKTDVLASGNISEHPEKGTSISPDEKKSHAWIQTGKTLEEDLKDLQTKSGAKYVTAIMNNYDLIKKNEPGIFTMYVINGKASIIAKVEPPPSQIEEKFKNKIRTGDVYFVNSCHPYSSYPVVYLRIFVHLEEDSQHKHAKGTIIESPTDFTNANFQEWVRVVESTKTTAIYVYDEKGNLLVEGQMHFDEKEITKTIQVLDQANDALTAIPEIKRDFREACQAFFKDHPDPFI